MERCVEHWCTKQQFHKMAWNYKKQQFHTMVRMYFWFAKNLLSITWVLCCIFWQGFGCCEYQTLVKICYFNIFCAKKLKKQRNSNTFLQNFGKNMFFKVCNKTLVECFIQSNIWELDLKYLDPRRIITLHLCYPSSDFKKRKWEMIKVLSTTSACK